MVNGFSVPKVVYQHINIFTTAEAPTAGRELGAAPLDANWYLAEIWEFHGVVGGASATLKFRKITNTAAPNAAAAAGTVVELTGTAGASTLDVTSTARTWQQVPLYKNTAARTFKPRNRLCMVAGGTIANYADAVIILKWIRVN